MQTEGRRSGCREVSIRDRNGLQNVDGDGVRTHEGQVRKQEQRRPVPLPREQQDLCVLVCHGTLLGSRRTQKFRSAPA